MLRRDVTYGSIPFDLETEVDVESFVVELYLFERVKGAKEFRYTYIVDFRYIATNGTVEAENFWS